MRRLLKRTKKGIFRVVGEKSKGHWGGWASKGEMTQNKQRCALAALVAGDADHVLNIPALSIGLVQAVCRRESGDV